METIKAILGLVLLAAIFLGANLFINWAGDRTWFELAWDLVK